MVDEARILMREAVVILTPYMGTQKIIERCDLDAPRKPRRHLQPFCMLIEHGVDDVNEGLIAVEEAVPAREEIPFEPPLALMLAQHLHDLSGARQVLIVVRGGRFPLPIGALEHRLETVGHRFIRTEDSEVP